MICKHEDKYDIYRMLALVILVLVQSTFILVYSSPYFCSSVSSTNLNTAIGHTNSLDMTVHESGIQQSMISCLSMDLKRKQAFP